MIEYLVEQLAASAAGFGVGAILGFMWATNRHGGRSKEKTNDHT